MCTIVGSIPVEVLRQRQEAARLDKPEVLREIRKFSKLKRDKLRAQAREERRVMSGKFNAIHKREG
jgi:hypothetical protein